MVNTTEACRTARVSERQARYWIAQGLIRPTVLGVGQGTAHRWSETDVEELSRLGEASRQRHRWASPAVGSRAG